MFILRVYHQGSLIKEVLISEGHHRIGRSPKSSQNHSVLQIDSPLLSKEHFDLILRDADFTCIDLNSRNGTFHKLRPSKTLMPVTKTRLTYDSLLFVGDLEISIAKKNELIQIKTLEDIAKEFHAYAANAPRMLSLESFYEDRALALTAEEKQRVFLEFYGHGPLQDYVMNENCREILANSWQSLYVDTGKGLRKLDTHFLSPLSYSAWVQRLVLQSKRRLDRQNPICEATMPDGSRLHVVLSPICSADASVSIRRFGHAPMSEAEAIRTRWTTPSSLQVLKLLVKNRASLIVSGGTSSGKTTLLNFLCQFISPIERILSIEDTFELKFKHENWVALQGRKANTEGLGGVELRELVQSALRMRPDRIIVGECRGKEVLDLMQALNTGHPGSMSTLHANSAEDAFTRLETLMLLHASNLQAHHIQRWIETGVDAFIHVSKNEASHREVQQIFIHKRMHSKISLDLLPKNSQHLASPSFFSNYYTLYNCAHHQDRDSYAA